MASIRTPLIIPCNFSTIRPRPSRHRSTCRRATCIQGRWPSSSEVQSHMQVHTLLSHAVFVFQEMPVNIHKRTCRKTSFHKSCLSTYFARSQTVQWFRFSLVRPFLFSRQRHWRCHYYLAWRERERQHPCFPSISSNHSVIHSHLFTILTFILLLCIFQFYILSIIDHVFVFCFFSCFFIENICLRTRETKIVSQSTVPPGVYPFTSSCWLTRWLDVDPLVLKDGWDPCSIRCLRFHDKARRNGKISCRWLTHWF